MVLLDSVRRFIRENDLAGPGTRVVAALSGGPDSTALVHLLSHLDRAGELGLVGVAHLNHQLRAAADRDEDWCREMAGRVGRPFVSERFDVLSLARREHRSIEDAARAARYRFLEDACARLGADVVALGHTRDDQAETLLLRLVRGAGPRGLGAMHPRNGRFIRPLLGCRRRQLIEFLEADGIAFLVDESNCDVSIPRNRVRAELLPLLETRFNPRIVEALAAGAAIARDEWQWMEQEAARLGSIERAPGVWHLDVAALAAAPRALVRAAVWRAMEKASRGRTISYEHVEAALQLLAPGVGQAGIDVPGHRVQRAGAVLVLTSRAVGAKGRAAPAAPNLFAYPLSIPGEVQLPDAGLLVMAESRSSGATPDVDGFAPADGRLGSDRQAVAMVRSDRFHGPLAVRNRRPGDRFHPIGRAGRKKLQDFFVDLKIARDRRDLIPIVVDADDKIVWVAGYAIDEEFRVTDATQPVLILRLKLLGGLA